MTFYHKKLRHIMEVRGLDDKELAKLGGISLTRFSEIINGKRRPTKTQIIRLSDNVAIPYYALFSKTFMLTDLEIIDYRQTKPGRLKLGTNAKAILRQVRLQKYFKEIYNRLNLPAPQRLSGITVEESAEQMAQSVRAELKLDHAQIGDMLPREFFKYVRNQIESLGVFVVQDHNISSDIDGFALFDETFSANQIFINSGKRSVQRQIFTLAHELCHILLRRSAISNDYEADNEVEYFCNNFAACLLIPRNQILSLIEARRLSFASYEEALSSSRVISSHFKCSVSSALLRVHQIGFSRTNYYTIFAKSFGKPGHDDSIKPKQVGGPKEGPDQGVIALAYLGLRAGNLIKEAINAGVASSLEISVRTGLSKARIEGICRNIPDNHGYL